MMTWLSERMRRLRRDQRGLTTVEYLIVLCLLAAVSVSTWKVFGSNLKVFITKSADTVGNELGDGLGNTAASVRPAGGS